MKCFARKRATHLLLVLVAALVINQGAFAAPGDISTFAGGTMAAWGSEVRDFDTLNAPRMVIADHTNPNDRIVIEAGGNRIRKVSSGSITTLAGATGLRDFAGDGGPARLARFAEPSDAAFDSVGNLYVADSANHRIRKIDAVSDIVTTFAGDGEGRFNGDGLAAEQTSFNYPSGLAFDDFGNMYIADRLNHRIRRIDKAAGVVTTVAGSGNYQHCGDATYPNGQSWAPVGDGGLATAACISNPWSVALRNNQLFLTDTHNHRIRVVDLNTGIIETVAGSGCKRMQVQYFLFSPQPGNSVTATTSDDADRPCSFEGPSSWFTGQPDQCRAAAAEPNPSGACLDEQPTDYFDAGGPGDAVAATSANLAFPRDIAFDESGNLYIADTGLADQDGNEGAYTCPASDTSICGGNRIRKVNIATNLITTFAGNGRPSASADLGDGGPASAAHVNQPQGLLITGNSVELAEMGNIEPATERSGKIRRVEASGIISTIIGTRVLLGCCVDDGLPALAAHMNNPRGIVVSPSGDTFISDTDHHRVIKVSPHGIVQTVAGKGSKPTFPTSSVGDGGAATDAELNFPRGLALDSAGQLYIADTENDRVRKVSPDGIITTVAGPGIEGEHGDYGPATGAWVSRPHDVAVDAGGNIYVAEPYLQRIRKVDTNGMITTFAGSGEICPHITFNGIEYDPPATIDSCGRFLPWGTGVYLGDKLPIQDSPNNYGKATEAKLNFPMGVAADLDGNVYIADTANHRIRKVDPQGWMTTIAGNGVPVPALLPSDVAGNEQVSGQGSLGDGLPATAASLSYPHDVVVDTTGVLYIADTYNARVRRVDAGGIITTVAGNGCHMPEVHIDERLEDFLGVDQSNGCAQQGEDGEWQGLGDGGPAKLASLRWPVALAIKGSDLLISEGEAENQTTSQASSTSPEVFNPDHLLIQLGYKSPDGVSAAYQRVRLVSGS